MKKFAIFFPQFYPIECNNNAWGYGFTDWALLVAANAFGYWRNRRVPANGFYDLSKVEDIRKNFLLASNSGIDGFGLYHYYFKDGSELNSTENFILNNGLPNNFQFFFIWANESWSKRWVGQNTSLLKVIDGNPSIDFIKDHVKYLSKFMKLDSYCKYDLRPIFVIYRPETFLNIDQTIELYRNQFKLHNLDVMIGFFLKSSSDVVFSNKFDFCYIFEPRLFFTSNTILKYNVFSNIFKFLVKNLPYSVVENISKSLGKLIGNSSITFSYKSFLESYKSKFRLNLIQSINCPIQEVINCGWNNAPRYKNLYTELEVPSSDEFAKMNSEIIEMKYTDHKLPLMCNAWNEWTEGAALEPCFYLGDYLLKSYVNSKIK